MSNTAGPRRALISHELRGDLPIHVTAVGFGRLNQPQQDGVSCGLFVLRAIELAAAAAPNLPTEADGQAERLDPYSARIQVLDALMEQIPCWT